MKGQKESIRVLSIDWDYFMSVTPYERATLFPDGGNENLPKSVRDILWVSYYSNERKGRNLIDIGLDGEFKAIKRVVRRQTRVKEVMIANSHKEIITLISDSIALAVCDGVSIEVDNVDFHHDRFNNGNDLNCGNWVLWLEDLVDLKYRWVSREDSDRSEELCEIGISDLRDDYDYIFLCKSDVWSPPHLDKKFNELQRLLVNLGVTTLRENGINYSRYNKEFESLVKTMGDIEQKVRTGNHERNKEGEIY